MFNLRFDSNTLYYNTLRINEVLHKVYWKSLRVFFINLKKYINYFKITAEKWNIFLALAKLYQEVARRDNLVVEGILESPNENIRGKVIDFFKTKLSLSNASDIVLSRVHRIGLPPHLRAQAALRPRPVIMRFQNYMDRDRVWKASWNLRERHLFVREDYTEAMKQRRS